MTKTRVEAELVTKRAEAFLVEIGGVRLPIGRVEITEFAPGASIDRLADEAFKMARASLQKLMPHRYRVVLVDESGAESAYGLDRWVKLFDRQKESEMALTGKGRKQPLRKSA